MKKHIYLIFVLGLLFGGLSISKADTEDSKKKINDFIAKQEKQREEAIMSKIKKTCSEFGYKKNTEKYADCMKDLYIKETSQPLVINNSNSEELANELKKQRRREAFDDLSRMSQDLTRNKGSARNSAPISSDVCFYQNASTSGFNKICYYKCVSGLKTKNIGATEICPLNF